MDQRRMLYHTKNFALMLLQRFTEKRIKSDRGCLPVHFAGQRNQYFFKHLCLRLQAVSDVPGH